MNARPADYDRETFLDKYPVDQVDKTLAIIRDRKEAWRKRRLLIAARAPFIWMKVDNCQFDEVRFSGQMNILVNLNIRSSDKFLLFRK